MTKNSNGLLLCVPEKNVTFGCGWSTDGGTKICKQRDDRFFYCKFAMKNILTSHPSTKIVI